MLPHDFDNLAIECFGTILIPHGFSSSQSKRSTFYRRASAEVWHFIMPDMRFKQAKYDIRVFFSSPIIDPEFEARFPDNLGIPQDDWSYLSIGKRVTHTPSTFPCSTKAIFRIAFEKAVGPALQIDALGYLNRFQTIADILPQIKYEPYAVNARGFIEKNR